MGITAAVVAGPVAAGLGNSSLALEIEQQRLRATQESAYAAWAAAGYGPGGTLVTAPAPEPEPRDPQPKLILEEPKATEPIVRQFPELDFSEQPEKPSS